MNIMSEYFNEAERYIPQMQKYIFGPFLATAKVRQLTGQPEYLLKATGEK